MSVITEKPFSRMLKYWRTKRGLSQLELSLAAGVSQRHISFLETGRTIPSRGMILRLSQSLDMPLRQQNELLQGAGYAPVYTEFDLDAPALAEVRKVLDIMLAKHEPYPAIVLDRIWTLRLANGAASRLLAPYLDADTGIGAARDAGSVNVVDLIFDPKGLRPAIENWDEIAGALIQRLHREAGADGPDGEVSRLIGRLMAYPDIPETFGSPDWWNAPRPLLTMTLRQGGERLTLLSTITTLGTPFDVTLEELRLETFFPADQETRLALEAQAAG